MISRAQPTGFLRRNRVKVTITLNLLFIGDTIAWLRYFLAWVPLFGYGESGGELLSGKVGPNMFLNSAIFLSSLASMDSKILTQLS